jgi:PAS domain S-box-containing protein
MSVSNSSSDLTRQLRKKAEARLKRLDQPIEDADIAARRLIHELQVHQIELEMQYDELQRNQQLINKAKERFADLYGKYVSLFDFSPIGYVVHDYRGEIQEVNLTFAAMLGENKTKVIGRFITDFIHRDSQDTFHLHRVRYSESDEKSICELRMVRKDKTSFDVQLNSLLFRAEPGGSEKIRTAVVDISAKVQQSRKKELIRRCLQIAGNATQTRPALEGFVREIKSFSGCEAVAIRMLDEHGNIPYQAYDGFSRSFYESESPLSLHTDRCMCISVIKGTTNPEQRFFTTGGSFFINATTKFLSTVSGQQKGDTRNVCNAYGYESVALIPISIGNDIMGLFHLADRRENMFPLSEVEMLESVAGQLALVLKRIMVQEEVKRMAEELNFLSSRLITVQEKEQRRIAMELHDQTGQDLNVLKIKMTAIRNRLRKDQPGVKAEAEWALQFVDKINNNIINLAYGLNPDLLEHLGLEAALNCLIRDFSEHKRVQITADFGPINSTFDRNTGIVFYRIVQEALTNITKHAGASRVRIALHRDNDRISVTIEDDGKGFDVPAIRLEKAKKKGMGLTAMAFRARMLGGNFEISSRAGRGTKIKVNLPVQEKAVHR